MADGEGALVAQQRAAAEEPYKNIALGNPAEKFLNAWTLASSVKDKQRQLQQQMMALQQRNAEFEYGMQFDKQKFAFDQMKFQTDTKLEQERLGISAGELALRKKAGELANQKYEDRQSGTEAILDIDPQLAAEGITPEDPRYWSEGNRLANLAAAKGAPASVINRWKATAAASVNNAATRITKNNEASYNYLMKDMGNKVFGTEKATDLDPVLNYQDTTKYPEEYKHQSWHDWYYNKPAEKTGYQLIPQTIGGKKLPPRRVKTTDLADLNQRYQTVMENFTKVPSPIHDPNENLYHPDTSINQARDAIRNGAPRDQVIQRLQRMGIQPPADM
jgi:hypothetical protein